MSTEPELQRPEDEAAAKKAEKPGPLNPDPLDTLERFKDVAREMQLPGKIHFFGSWANGLKTASSDCDVVYIMDPEELAQGDTPTTVLQKFAVSLQKSGFISVVTVFHAIIPLLKAVDPCGTDIDLCVQNLLGYRNSQLLQAYCNLDERVALLGQRVKHWARHFDVSSSIDGHINCYGYSLLAIFFLMHSCPPVVPNLQALADAEPEVLVPDGRWGTERAWDCKFWTEIDLLPQTQNKDDLGDLLLGFFAFYLTFDWKGHAVSIRSGLTRGCAEDRHQDFPEKAKMHGHWTWDQWYVEDPFDLGHNLAAKCTERGRRRILKAMSTAYQAMKDHQDKIAAFDALCSSSSSKSYYLKCRVHPNKVCSDSFVDAFADFPAVGFWWPRPPANVPGGKWRMEDRPEAYIEFESDADRKQAHTINETYVGGWQLRLFVCSRHVLDDAFHSGCRFDRIDSYASSPKGSPEEFAQQLEISRSSRERRRSRRKARDAGQEAEKAQVRIVREGINHAEVRDELEVLEQRAKALGMKKEVRIAQQKMQLLPFKPTGNRSRGPSDDFTRSPNRSPKFGSKPPPLGSNLGSITLGSQPNQDGGARVQFQ